MTTRLTTRLTLGFLAVLNRPVFDAVFWRHLNVLEIKKDEYGVRLEFLIYEFKRVMFLTELNVSLYAVLMHFIKMSKKVKRFNVSTQFIYLFIFKSKMQGPRPTKA